MGHTTKDAPHLMTFLMDYLAPCSTLCRQVPQGKAVAEKLRVQLTLIYGNVCASYPAPKLDEPFRRVIMGWFHALFRGDSPFIELMTLWGIDFVLPASTSGNNTLHVNEVFYKTAMSSGGFFCPHDEVSLATPTLFPAETGSSQYTMWIITRWERFRWFRTRAQANFFRRCLLHYYKIPPRPSGHSVLLLQRLHGRRFDEAVLRQKFLALLKPYGVSVSTQTFRSMSYNLQASFMRNSSIFVASHGAGMVNIMTMLPGSVVVELFPHGFRYAMYEELARLLGLHYIAYESPEVWPPRCCRQRGGDSASQLEPPLQGNPPKTTFGVRSCKECDIKILEEDIDPIIFDAWGIVSANDRLRSIRM
ncbi:hypothetical protein TRSC58_05811 [Trypanosoma rangeli SC58]|uniref:Glycosyltransferase 61 catalytic domain-containing protein n=1 Tax=Trypanosoma rangeli SC58 TaxID=429131 RepID=A0A061IV38_TRYRA|nr:hypothetical protein TRSC58_05811 [Trypanosoma rangeli SC58]